jgi:hypothetical protein
VFDDNAATCNGLWTTTYIDYNTGIQSAKDFCGTNNIVLDSNRPRPRKTFNQGAVNEVQLYIIPNGDVTITPDECQELYKILLDGCDSNPLNPSGAKHGGNVNYPSNKNIQAALFLLPKAGANPHCSGPKYGKWIYAADTAQPIQDTCQMLTGNTQNTITHEALDDKGTPVTFSIYFIEDFIPAIADCKAAFGNIISGCDGDKKDIDPKNLKFGGTYTQDNKVLYVVNPKV